MYKLVIYLDTDNEAKAIAASNEIYRILEMFPPSINHSVAGDGPSPT